MGKAKRTGLMALTPKQRKFVEHFDGKNATDAAAKAGYAGPRANHKNVGYKLLKDPNVRMAILAKEKKARGELKIIATRAARQQFWTDIMNDPAADLKDRLKASELLGRSEADFTDKHVVAATTLEELVIGSMQMDAPTPAQPLPEAQRASDSDELEIESLEVIND